MDKRTKKQNQDAFVLFISLLIIALLILSLSTVINMKRTIDGSIERYIHYVSETIYIKTVAYLEPVNRLNDMLFETRLIGEDFIQNNQNLIGPAKSFLKAYPQLQSFIIGNEAGAFFLFKNEGDLGFSQRLIDPASDSAKTVDITYDNDMHVLSSKSSATIDFDPRVRPWYIGAQSVDSNFWTNLYIFYMDQTPGLTISHHYQNKDGARDGVFGFDINIFGVSGFLSALDLGTGGQVMIVNESNQIVAFSKPSMIFNADMDYTAVNFNTFENGLFSQALSVSGSSEALAHFSIDGIQYISMVKSLESSLSVPWRIIIVFQSDAFVKPYQLTLNFVLVTFFFSLVLLTSLSVYRKREQIAKNQLNYVAYHDHLSQLYNRHYFSTAYQTHLEKSVQHYTLILADLDRFKSINDTLGHHVGDLVIAHLSGVMRQQLTPYEQAFRWGGEEFLFVLENQTLAQAQPFVTKLQQTLKDNPMIFEGSPLSITLSFGAAYCQDHAFFKETIALADEKLYQAKSQGRDRLCL